MGENQKENVNKKTNENKIPEKNSQLLNIFLTLIVLATVITGAVIYYSLYKYSSNENIIALNVTNSPKEEVSTVADILDTALNSNVTNTEEDQSVSSSSNSRKYYCYNRRS